MSKTASDEIHARLRVALMRGSHSSTLLLSTDVGENQVVFSRRVHTTPLMLCSGNGQQ